MSDALAIYLHWPYCARICPYCDFNVFKQRGDNPDLIQAMLDDLSFWRDWSGARSISSIHFGGGTPSLLAGEDIARFIRHIDKLWELGDGCEIALEANPNNLTHWEAYKNVGINRLSLGVQTFNEAALKFLGRDHNGLQAKQALDKALSLFPSVSLDLIFGWKNQSAQDWQCDIDIAIKSGVPHISAYQLTIEEGTAFERAERRGDIKAVNSDKSAVFYDMADHAFTGAGYEHYEVSNYAKPGHLSKHNLTYWQGGDYVGVGPGAHGRLSVNGQRYATETVLKPHDYCDHVKSHSQGMSYKEALSPEAWGEEYVMMGLRIDAGFNRARAENLLGRTLGISALREAGLLSQKNGNIHATPDGRRVLNAVIENLLV